MDFSTQITGGNFKDIAGNPLAQGYLLFELSADAAVNSTTSVSSGYVTKVYLDDTGNIPIAPPQYVWANDLLSPTSTFYMVSGYSKAGQLVWGPNAQKVLSTTAPFDVGTWVPGIVG